MIAAILALIAAAIFVTVVVVLTIKWIRSKIRDRLLKEHAQKVFTADIREMAKNCKNSMSMDELDKIVDEGYTHMMATVDDNGEVQDLELIKDKNTSTDADVKRILGREGMLVVQK